MSSSHEKNARSLLGVVIVVPARWKRGRRQVATEGVASPSRRRLRKKRKTQVWVRVCGTIRRHGRRRQMEVSSDVVWVVGSEGWEVRSASWREPERASRRGSAQHIRVVVDSSVVSLSLSWSGFRRREPVSSTESKVPRVLDRGRTSIASKVLSWKKATGAHPVIVGWVPFRVETREEHIVIVGRVLFHEGTTCALCRGPAGAKRGLRPERGRTNLGATPPGTSGRSGGEMARGISGRRGGRGTSGTSAISSCKASNSLVASSLSTPCS